MASTKRIIRKTLLELMQSEQATVGERLKAARLLTNLLISTQTRNRGIESTPKDVWNDILSEISKEANEDC
jgi:hypothetical protein